MAYTLKKSIVGLSYEDIIRINDKNPSMTLRELSNLTGFAIPFLKSLLMQGKSMTLPDMLRTYSIVQLLDFADSLDPNNGWREAVAEDDSITRDSLADAMLTAYDDADTHAWLQKMEVTA
jgi:hypothetical protein